ncbi:MAG: hypothetical protein OIN85_00750 [Candidatus Methanoperedens sp.]|nr:hypothetical protein [Candidatus Methanoperedens sp.]
MSLTKFDIRQSITRVLQDQLNAASNINMDSTLASINNELTSPGRLIAASTPSLVVTVGSGTVVNPNTSKNRVLPLLNNVAIPFTGGTITFPGGVGGGTITVSPGTNGSITIGANQFAAVLVQLDASGNINLVVGSNAGSLGAVVVPGGSTTMLSLGYIIVQSNGSSIIQSVTNAMIYQFVGGGGAGGSGSGTGDDLDALQYQASFTDTFSDLPTSTTSSIDMTAGHTNATYSATNKSFSISYDASKTVTGTGTSMTLSGTPAFTVVAGDVLVVAGQARKITTVNTQTSYVIESAFSTDPSGAAAEVSQAVYTKDINQFAGDGISIFSIYGDSINDVLVTYNDTSSGTLYNNTDPALIAFSASSDGSSYSSNASREANLSASMNATNLPTTGSNLYIRFFANKTSGSGTVNLVGYKAFFHRNTLTEGGGILNQAYCFTNSVGTPVNCSNPQIVGGKTQVTVTFTFPVGVNSGTANGSLVVYLNGQKIPRFINSTLTPDASYTETSPNTIALDTDYSGFNYSLEIYQNVSVVDSNTQNTTNISTINSHRFRNYVINGNFDFWQRNTSFTTPSSGAYTADRFTLGYDGSIGTFTVSQQAFTLGQTNVPNEPAYFYRWNQTAAGSGSTTRNVEHRIESVKTLAGKQVTLTFYAKADTARTVGTYFIQYFGTGGSPSSATLTTQQNFNLTTSWQLFTYTVALPSISGKTLGTNGNDSLQVIWELPVNTTMTIDLAQIMVNEGSVAAPWAYASGGSSLFYESELGLCQRFCQVFGKAPDQTNNAYGSGFAATTTSSIHYMKFHRTMRANPTMTATAADWAVQRNAGTVVTATVIGFNNVGTSSGRVGLNVAAGLTAGEGLVMVTNNQNGMILDAEL